MFSEIPMQNSPPQQYFAHDFAQAQVWVRGFLDQRVLNSILAKDLSHTTPAPTHLVIVIVHNL